MNTPHARTLASLAASVGLMVFAAGCAGPSSASPWAAEFEALRTKVEPDSLAARIIEDNQITESEIRELYDTYTACLKDAGLDASIDNLNGEMTFHRVDGLSNEELTALDEPCREGLYIGDMQILWNDISINPQHIDRHDAIVQCLIEKKVVDPSTTGAQYKAIEESVNLAVFGDPNDPEDEGDTPYEYAMELRELPLTVPFEEAIPAWEVCSINRIPY